jgi:hypothetical protein
VGSVAGWLSKYVPRAFAILVAGVRTYINIYRTVVVTAFKVVRTIIGAVGSFVAASVKFYIAYLNGVRSVLGKVVSFVKSIPGKVVAALGNLGSVLFNSGRALLEGFARGITSKVGEVYGAAKSALSKVRNLFPHSPAKEGPFSGKGWTLHSGQALMTGLADGITRSKGKVKSAIVQVLDAVKQQVQQLSSSVSQAFGGDLFSATSGVKFLQNLTTTGGTVGRLKAAFAKLLKWGWRPDALSALFQSGNSSLILSLASSQALATQAARQYQSVQSGLSSLGGQVANTQYSLAQDRTLRKFDDLIRAVRSVGIDVGSEINGATKKGKKKQPMTYSPRWVLNGLDLTSAPFMVVQDSADPGTAESVSAILASMIATIDAPPLPGGTPPTDQVDRLGQFDDELDVCGLAGDDEHGRHQHLGSVPRTARCSGLRCASVRLRSVRGTRSPGRPRSRWTRRARTCSSRARFGIATT